MKHNKYLLVFFAAFYLSLMPFIALAGTKVSAKDFADPKTQKLDVNRAAFYLMYYYDVPASKFLDKKTNQISLDTLNVVKVMGGKLNNLTSEYSGGHPAPWTPKELDAKFYKMPNPSTNGDGFRLRGNSSDLSANFKDSKGTTIGFSRNALPAGKNTWNSEGAFGYYRENSSVPLLPAITWKLNKVEGVPAAQNTEDLNFSIPVIKYFNQGHLKVLAKPYFQTDFSIDYKIFGAEASAEYNGDIPVIGIHTGGYYWMGMDSNSNWRYKVIIIPKIDYSATNQEGVHTTRKKGDDWFRAGGLASLDFQVIDKIPFNVGVSYDFLQSVGGNGSNGHEFSTYGTYWVNDKKNVALTLKYTKGTTLVAAEKVDLLTFGLEFKQ